LFFALVSSFIYTVYIFLFFQCALDSAYHTISFLDSTINSPIVLYRTVTITVMFSRTIKNSLTHRTTHVTRTVIHNDFETSLMWHL